MICFSGSLFVEGKREMNPRDKARKVFEQCALAIRQTQDPIAPIEAAIWEARHSATYSPTGKIVTIVK